jgi:hypothetical protein
MSWSTITREEKLDLMKSLNWYALDTPEEMLAVIEGTSESSGTFDTAKLFVKSLERLRWYSIIGLWGVENIKKLYTEDLANRIWPKSRRKEYDIAIGLLREDAIPTPRWGDGTLEQTWGSLLSNRWHCSEQRLFPP